MQLVFFLLPEEADVPLEPVRPFLLNGSQLSISLVLGFRCSQPTVWLPSAQPGKAMPVPGIVVRSRGCPRVQTLRFAPWLAVEGGRSHRSVRPLLRLRRRIRRSTTARGGTGAGTATARRLTPSRCRTPTPACNSVTPAPPPCLTPTTCHE